MKWSVRICKALNFKEFESDTVIQSETTVRKSNFPTEESKQEMLHKLSAYCGSSVITSAQINAFCKAENLPYPYFLTYDKSRSAGWGKYKVSDVAERVADVLAPVATKPPVVSAIQQAIASDAVYDADAYVPEKDVTYVPFGFYNDLKNVIQSQIFYPVYITGLSGNGKTLMVQQICAALNRELVRVNITKDTDELDLFGCYELINGNTVRKEGPVLTAMKRGAILLLDETDYGSERLLCLQPVLEGKPFLDKKTNTVVHPQPGFNVIATANTKGKGSNDGRFIGANVLNEAFLERFAITVEQEYPNATTEKKILQRNFEQLSLDEPQFVDCLISWAEQVRKGYSDGSIDEVVSTRRLVHIAKAFAIFKDRKKAIRLCLNRFDDDTKTVLLDFYEKIDEAANKASQPKGEPVCKEAPKLRKGDIGSPSSSSTEYVVLASRFSKVFSTPVVIAREMNPSAGADDVAVYAKGNRVATQVKALADMNISPSTFEQQLRKMVESAIQGITF